MHLRHSLASDDVSHDAALAVGGTGQRDERHLASHVILDLWGSVWVGWAGDGVFDVLGGSERQRERQRATSLQPRC